MASLCSSADWACMACSWWAADIWGGRSRGYGVPARGHANQQAWLHTSGRSAIHTVCGRNTSSSGFVTVCNGASGCPYRRQGVGASRVRAAAGRGGRWGCRREGKGSGPGGVLLPGGLLAGGPQSLGDTRDIRHHLLGVSMRLFRVYSHIQLVTVRRVPQPCVILRPIKVAHVKAVR